MTYICNFVRWSLGAWVEKIFWFNLQLVVTACHTTTKAQLITNPGGKNQCRRKLKLSNKMGWLRAVKTLRIPQATIKRHALGKNKTLVPNTKALGRFKLTFPHAIERTFEHLKFLGTDFLHWLIEPKGLSHQCWAWIPCYSCMLYECNWFIHRSMYGISQKIHKKWTCGQASTGTLGIAQESGWMAAYVFKMAKILWSLCKNKCWR